MRITALAGGALLMLGACTGDGTAPGTTSDDGDGTASPDTTDPSTTGPAPDPSAAVEWGDCPVEVPSGADVDCGTLTVPTDRDEPDAGELELAFGVVRADDPVAEDPLVYLGGGPGEHSLATLGQAFEQYFDPLVSGRDLIVVDQRGTGHSEPDLTCDEYRDWAADALASDQLPEPDDGVRALQACRDRLRDEGIDPALVNSTASAADLDDLRRALGYDEWNLYGISYGTRLALTAMRDAPTGIRSVVLDAAYPHDANLYAEMPDNVDRARQQLVGACNAAAACSERFGDIGEHFERAVARLGETPVETSTVDPATGARRTVLVDDATFVGAIFQSMYDTDLIRLLPEIIEAASEGDVDMAGALMGPFTSSIELTSMGMQLAVQCQEEVPFTDRVTLEEAVDRHPAIASFFRAEPRLGPDVVDLCDDWDAGEPTELDDDPVTSEIPTLVLAGEFDPVTPPAWSERVGGHLANASVHVVPGSGHGAVVSYECPRVMMHAFLAGPGQSPDAGCLDDIDPPGFTAETIDVDLETVDDAERGIERVSPDGWPEVAPGVAQRSILETLVQQPLPGVTPEQALSGLSGVVDDGDLEPVDNVETDALTWDVYEFTDLGQRIDLALATGEDGLLHLVQLASTPERRPALVDQVFTPALEAYRPAGG